MSTTQEREEVSKLYRRISDYGPKTAGHTNLAEIRKRSAPYLPEGIPFDNVDALVEAIYVLPPETRDIVLSRILDLEEEALSFLCKFCTTYAFRSERTVSRFKNLYFFDSGASRLSNIAGWLQGMAHVSEEGRTFSKKAALAFLKTLDYLNSYGGDMEVNTAGGVVTVPRYRVTLNDDGILNSFSILWYRAITNKQRHEKAQAIFDTRISPTEQLVTNTDRLWEQSLKEAEDQIGLFDKLTIHRFYRHGSSSESEVVYYGRAFNGGLIYHGPGAGETFSVNLDPAAAREHLWSVHT